VEALGKAYLGFSSIVNKKERLKIMSRHTATAMSSVSLWAGVEGAVRRTLTMLSAAATQVPSLEQLESEQARIRQSSRHWLLG
jgi:hypothetical protein